MDLLKGGADVFSYFSLIFSYFIFYSEIFLHNFPPLSLCLSNHMVIGSSLLQGTAWLQILVHIVNICLIYS